MRSLMKNPKTAKILKEAMDAPLGSTARVRAQKMLNTMNKLHLRQDPDGMGGPGMMMIRQEQQPEQKTPEKEPDHIMTSEVKGLVYFHAVPHPTIKYGPKPKKGNAVASRDMIRAGSTPDGQGGPGDAFSSWLGSNSGGSTSLNALPGGGKTDSSVYKNLAGAPENPFIPPSYGGIQGTIPDWMTKPRATIASEVGGWIDTAGKAAPYVAAEGIKKTGNVLGDVLGTGLKWAGNVLALPGKGIEFLSTPPDIGGTPAAVVTPNKPSTTAPHLTIGKAPPAAPATTKGATPTTTGTGTQIQTGGTPKKPVGPTTSGTTGTTQTGAGAPAPTTTGTGTTDTKTGTAGTPSTTGTPTSTFGVGINDPSTTGAGVSSPTTTGQAPTGWDAQTYASFKAANPTLEPTAEDTAAMLAQKTGTTALTAEQASQQNLGKGMYAMSNILDPNNPITGGMTEAEAAAANEADTWKKYGLDELTSKVTTMQTAKNDLPTDMQAYLRQKDEYVNKIDGQINDFLAKLPKMDLSIGDNATQANNYLNYLTTLKGRQNQRYAGYLSNAKEQVQNELDTATANQKEALDGYEKEIKSSNAITSDMYKMYTDALTGQYDAVDGAQEKALRLEQLRASINASHLSAALDAMKLNAQNDWTEIYPKLKGFAIDGNGYLLPNASLSDAIGTLSPAFGNVQVLQGYLKGLDNTLSTDTFNGTAKLDDGTPIDSNVKDSMLSSTYKEMADMMSSQPDAQSKAAIAAGPLSTLVDLTKRYSQTKLDSTSTINDYKTAVNALYSEKHWYNPFGSSGPTNVTDYVNSLPSSMKDFGPYIYARYQRYITTPGPEGGTSQEFINSAINDTSSDTDNPPPRSNADIVSNQLAPIYAQSLLDKNGITPILTEIYKLQGSQQ